MIQVTESAKGELKSILSANVDDPQASLRLTVSDQGQLGLSVDEERPGDHVVEHEGAKVLLVEDSLAADLEGVTLDTQDTPEGTKLIVSQES